MARYQKQRKVEYPMGSISHGTMRNEDLIPVFCDELNWLAGHPNYGSVPRKRRVDHLMLFVAIMDRTDDPKYFDSEDADTDLNETLCDALQEYAAPYFYFGAHPGDGSDYGFWLSEEFENDFDGLKVSDTSEIPSSYRGEVAVVNDHGNVTLYVKTARTLREIWAVV